MGDFDREIIGDLEEWGRGLSRPELGQALAALGTALGSGDYRAFWRQLEGASNPARLGWLIQHAPSRLWRLRPLARLHASDRRGALGSVSAKESAKAWRSSVDDAGPNQLVRLRIERWTSMAAPYLWLTDLFAHPEVRVACSVIRYERFTGNPMSRPIRVATIPGPAAELLKPLGRSSGVVMADSLDQPPDLLIVPSSVRNVLGDLGRLPGWIGYRVPAIAAIGGGFQPDEPLMSVGYASLGRRFGTWLFFAADISLDELGGWSETLAQALASDQPLDVGFARAGRLLRHGPGLLIVDPALLRYSEDPLWRGSRLSRRPTWPLLGFLSGLDAPIESLGGFAARRRLSLGFEMASPDRLDRFIKVPAEPAELPVSGPEKPDATIDWPAVLDMDEAAAARPRAAFEPEPEPAEPEERWLQVEVAPNEAESPAPPVRTVLRPSTDYRLDVWIAPLITGIKADEPFPSPDAEDTCTLQVVFLGTGGGGQIDARTIDLPKTGPSTRCSFRFVTRDAGKYEARLLVSHDGRILQTAVLSATVAPADTEVQDATILLEVEPVGGTAREPAARSGFDAALVEYPGPTDTHAAVLVAQNQIIPLVAEDCGPAVQAIAECLTSIAIDPDRFGPTLKARPSVKLLFQLAQQGSLLRDKLVGANRILDESLRSAGRMQIVSSHPESAIPFELAYDFPAPTRAVLCKNWHEAARTGTCADPGHAKVVDGNLPFVCPAGFWAVNRVLERQRMSGPDADSLRGAPAGLRIVAHSAAAEPAGPHDHLPDLRHILFGAANKVDGRKPGTIERVEDAFVELGGADVRRVESWQDWVKGIKRQPTLLVLLSHTQTHKYGVPGLIIGERDECYEANINEAYVRLAEAPGPVVLLLGCETALPTATFQSFVGRFRQKGAAIVLATLSAVPGAHAAEAAICLAKALNEARTGPESPFGEVLTGVRRQLLVRGELISLTLAAFGDADWMLGGQAS